MRILALLLVSVLSSAAFAADIPVSGPYGSTKEACALYKAGGAIAVGGGPDSVFVVSPTETVYLEGGCAPTSVRGQSIVLACGGEGDEWTSHASISFDASRDTLYFKDENGTTTLHRCR